MVARTAGPFYSIPTFLLVLTSQGSVAAATGVRDTGARSGDGVDTYYVSRMSDRFATFAARHQAAVDNFHASEQDRLEVAIRDAPTAGMKTLLEGSAAFNEESRLEAQNAFNEMRNFVSTLKQAMGAVGSVASCSDLTCGSRAFCEVQPGLGAYCRCEDGYEGNGFVCNPPTRFTPHALIEFRPDAPFPEIADLHIGTFSGNRVAVVYRDASRQHGGYFMLGHAAPHGIDWGEPALFSGASTAFSPVVTEIGTDSSFAIAFRDQDRGGSGMLASGRHDPVTGNVTIGAAKAFARHQAQGMAVVPLTGSLVAVLFSEHALSGTAAGGVQGHAPVGGAMYGSAVLASVDPAGVAQPELLGKQRFVNGPVARITAERLSPTTFAIAYRLGDTGVSMEKAEASVMLGRLRDQELVFGPESLSLEPEQSQIWGRRLTSLGGGTFAYTYHSGTEQLTKQAVLRMDPATEKLHMLRRPEVVAKGFSPHVGAVSSALIQDDGSSSAAPLRMFTYFSRQGSPKAEARLCGVSAETGVLVDCHEVTWSDREIRSAAGAPLGDGRLVMAYTDSRGSPFYQLVGLKDASA